MSKRFSPRAYAESMELTHGSAARCSWLTVGELVDLYVRLDEARAALEALPAAPVRRPAVRIPSWSQRRSADLWYFRRLVRNLDLWQRDSAETYRSLRSSLYSL